MKWFFKQFGKRIIFFIIAVIVFLALVRLFPINTTASMPYGVYMRLPAWNIKEGDLVELDNPIDSSYLGVYDKHGLLKRVDHINEDGTYYVLGEHELSYDSRYFGSVDKSYIKSKLIPIWTTTELPDWLKKTETTVTSREH